MTRTPSGEASSGFGRLGRRPAGIALLATTGLLLAVWALDVGAGGLPRRLCQGVVLFAIAVLLGWCAAAVRRLLRGDVQGGRAAGRALLAVLLLGFAVRLVGIDWELVDHPRSDEGVYYERAQQINDGDLLPEEMNYGHFLYYSGALLLWAQELFPDATHAMTHALYGVETPFEDSRILLRGFNGVLGALTTVAVFWTGFHLAGPLAALLGALLSVFSPLYNDFMHTVICDVPAAFFAALCLMFVSRLAVAEGRRDYLLAGLAAGLAAGSKYPGGVAAVGIFGVWLAWRLRHRRWSWSLLEAAVASVVTLLAVMPALWLDFGRASSGEGLDVMFGWRQYALGGWHGVIRENTPLWYGRHLLDNFGWPAALLGLSGALWLDRSQRRRWAVLWIFPVAYFTLISAMRMSVVRNLLPILPTLAALAGAGAAAWISRFGGGERQGLRRALAAGLGLLTLAQPAFATISWDISRTRPGTRQLAEAWFEANVPAGAGVVKEEYSPRFGEQYDLLHVKTAAWLSLEEITEPRWDFLVLARSAHLRFFDPELEEAAHAELFAERYRRMYELEVAARFEPSRLRGGSELTVLRLDPERVRHQTRRRFRAADSTYTSDPGQRADGDPEAPIHFRRRGQMAVFKDYFQAGRYRFRYQSTNLHRTGFVHVVSRDNIEVGVFRLKGLQPVDLELPADGKYLLRVFLAAGSALEWIDLQRTGEASEAGRSPEGAVQQGGTGAV